jgi:hypothetical protein
MFCLVLLRKIGLELPKRAKFSLPSMAGQAPPPQPGRLPLRGAKAASPPWAAPRPDKIYCLGKIY